MTDSNTSGWPTNPSFVRRVVKGMGHAHVRVSPSTGDVFIKDIAGKWVVFGTTAAVLSAAKAAHRAKYRERCQ